MACLDSYSHAGRGLAPRGSSPVVSRPRGTRRSFVESDARHAGRGFSSGGSIRRPELRFFADAMLGRLATWMRILGLDVEYEADIEDSILEARARDEDRLILTRDTRLVKRRGVRERCLLIESDHVEEQLSQVVGSFGITASAMLTRCLRCNMPLKAVKRASVEALVPRYVYETESRFSTCPGCARVYWGGTHKAHIIKALRGVVEGID